MTKNLDAVPDNPEWTKERFSKAVRVDGLPAAVQKAVRRKARGPQKKPTKTLTSIRLSPDVLTALRSRGRGWQSLADQALRQKFVGDNKAADHSAGAAATGTNRL